MFQLKSRMIPFLLALVLFATFASTGTAFADTISVGPVNHPTAEAYRIGGERVKLKAQVVYTTDYDQLNAIVEDTYWQSGTHVWDNQWYYWSLPDTRSKFLLLSWYNTTADTYGWLVLDKDSDGWWFKTNSKGWQKLNEGSTYTATWYPNGYHLDIDIRNPYNSGDWNQYDIWYSFGE